MLHDTLLATTVATGHKGQEIQCVLLKLHGQRGGRTVTVLEFQKTNTRRKRVVSMVEIVPERLL